MPLSKLDGAAALVVIDLQKGIVGLPTVHSAQNIIDRAAQLAAGFRERGLPVVLVNVTGAAPGRTEAGPRKFPLQPDWAELVPELKQRPEDCLITKQRWGAFIGTSLHEYLSQHNVTQIFLAGISTSAGVESTARSAYDHGYNVALVVDAMTDRDAEAHRHCLDKVFPRLGEMDTTENVLRLLKKPPAK